MQVNFNRTQAAQGQELVVAASHLILRRRHPSQARITKPVSKLSPKRGRPDHDTFQSLVTVVLVDKDIV
jgi:hypothetical protein